MSAHKIISQVRTMARRSINARFIRVTVLVAVLLGSGVGIAPQPAAANHLSVGIVGMVLNERGSALNPESFNGTLRVEVKDQYGNSVFSTMFGTAFLLTVPANNLYYFRAYGMLGRCRNGGGLLSYEGSGWVYVGETTIPVHVWMSPTWIAC